ncbi:MAG: sulfotransferase [Pseudomonadota bacterium]
MSEIDFASAALIDEAQAQAGLEDFGDARFHEGLEVLLETLDRHVKDDEFRAKQREMQLNRLVTRLQIQAAFSAHPEIEAEDILRPMVVTGLPRSGTSALFNLLDADPDARGLLMWEAVFPQPNEELAPGEIDPRYSMIKDYFEENRDADFQKIHFSSADTPEECCVLQVYSFDGVQTGWEILLEPYCSWFKQHDMSFLYEEHRRHLQLLQWQRPGTRWLLKAPAHMWALPQLAAVFPDLCLVWGHREPLAVTASIASMTEALHIMNAGALDEAQTHALGRGVMDWYASSLERGLRDREALPASAIFDYGFDDFVADPRATIEGIYSHFGLPLGAATEAALLEHMAENAKGKHGKHEYDLAHFGLSEALVHERFKFYMDNPLI